MSTIETRLGDGSMVEMSEKELMEDLTAGSEDAAARAEVPPLNKEDYEYLMDLFKQPDRFVGVRPGREVIMSYDAGTLKIKRHALFEDRVNALGIYERFFGADTMELCHVDYSYKPLKPIASYEQGTLEQALLVTHAPLFYGAMPNLGLYTQPDGPFPNPMELLPAGKIDEARASYDLMVADAVKDIVFIADCMYESGADGLNMDTVGASGDADVLASFIACEEIRKRYPDFPVMIGMAGEFVLGMHGQMEYKGERLAGLYPHKQVKLAEQAGATIFGPVVNTVTNESVPWNLARAITFIRPCSEIAKIPIFANMGMGVGAIPVTDYPPVEIVSRASKAMVELCNLDGL